jgi:hypothetical protein
VTHTPLCGEAVVQKGRIPVDVSDLRGEIETCRDDAAWGELPLAAKIRVLIRERLDQLKKALVDDSASPAAQTDTGDRCEQMRQLILLLLDLRQRRGIAFTEIANYVGEGVTGAQLENLYQELIECRQKESQPKNRKSAH